MISKDLDFRLTHALTDEKVADEVAARLISSTPSTPAEAQQILDILDKSLDKSIQERMAIALAGDDRGAAGKEIASKLLAMISVLEAKADGDEIAAEAAQFSGQVAGMTTDVTIDADNAGAAGNITLVADSVKDIDTLISDWNLANGGNTVTLSSGDGSQVPTADIILSGGSEASDGNLAPAKAAMGSDKLSKSAKFSLVHALTDQKAADEFESAYNAMIDAVQAIV